MLNYLLALAVALSGRVVDQDGRPVSDVVVTLVESKQAITTRNDGTFNFTSVPAGSYTVVARKLGYAPVANRVTVGATDAELTLTLRTAPFRAEPVTVTATRSASEALLSPMPLSVLTGDRVHRDASISIAKSVSTLPGVRDISTGQQIGKPVVRGLYGSRVLVAHDGSRLEDYSWSEEDGPSIDARLAERVEVIRGPASILYGSDALSGVVNVVPEELPFSPSGDPVYHAAAELFSASNNIELGSFARVDGAQGRFGWRVAGTGRFASSYQTPSGKVAHTGFVSANVDAAAIFRAPLHSATLRFSHYGGEFQLLEANGPPAPPGGVAQEEGPERILIDDRVQVSGNHLFGRWRLETKAQFQRHSLIEKSDDCVPPPGQTSCPKPPPGEEATAFDLLLNTTSADVLAHHDLTESVSGTVGVSGMYQRSVSYGPIYLVPDATISSGALFALEQLKVGRIRFTAGARVEERNLSADANAQLQRASDSRSYTASVAHAAIAINPIDPLALVASYGMGWRAPTIFDLYANGPHLAEARYEVGDPALRHEMSRNVDVGVRWSSDRVHADISAYQNSVGHFIFLQPTAATQNGLKVYQHTQADARFRGAEGMLEVRVVDPLSVRIQHDFVFAEKSASGDALPLIPPARTIGGFSLQSRSLSWAQRAAVAVELEHSARQARLDPNDTPTAAYTLLNLDFDVERVIKSRAVRVDLDVRNVTNVAYRDFLSRYKQFALNPGVSVILRVGTQLF